MRFKYIVSVMVFGVFCAAAAAQKTQVQRAKNVLIIYSGDKSF